MFKRIKDWLMSLYKPKKKAPAYLAAKPKPKAKPKGRPKKAKKK